MKKEIIATTLIFAAASFLLTPVLWPFSTDPSALPPGSIMPFFQAFGILSSLTFGIGVSFLLFAWKPMRKADAGFGLPFWTYAALSWSLISWWPHENLHRTTEGNWYALLWIEYGFHATLYISAAIAALYVFTQFTKRS